MLDWQQEKQTSRSSADQCQHLVQGCGISLFRLQIGLHPEVHSNVDDHYISVRVEEHNSYQQPISNWKFAIINLG